MQLAQRGNSTPGRKLGNSVLQEVSEKVPRYEWVGTRRASRPLPTQTYLWFWDSIFKLGRAHHSSSAMHLLQHPFIINSAALAMTGQQRLGVIHNGENYLFWETLTFLAAFPFPSDAVKDICYGRAVTAGEFLCMLINSSLSIHISIFVNVLSISLLWDTYKLYCTKMLLYYCWLRQFIIIFCVSLVLVVTK